MKSNFYDAFYDTYESWLSRQKSTTLVEIEEERRLFDSISAPPPSKPKTKQGDKRLLLCGI